MYVCRFAHGGDTRSLSEPGGLLRESPVLQEAYTKACHNSAKKITAASWCHVMTPCKFHDFQASFGFIGIKKQSFSIFPTEPRRPDV